MIFYSKTENAFYSDELKDDYELSNSWPADAVAIDDETYNVLLTGQGEGKAIKADSKGNPVLVEPVIDYEQQAIQMKNILMNEAAVAITPLQYASELGIATDAESELLIAWKKHMVLLRRVDTSKPELIVWPTPPAS